MKIKEKIDRLKKGERKMATEREGMSCLKKRK